jgi:Amt family ammonium transporter
MPAPIETFRSYGALLQRLFPQLSHALIAGANGTVLWVSDPQAARALDGTRSRLVRNGTDRRDDIDGLADPDDVAARFGFRVRTTHGELLAFVLVAVDHGTDRRLDLAAVHGLLRPALDCMQGELSARTLLLDGDELLRIPGEALQLLDGALGVLLLPECNVSLSRGAHGAPRAADVEILSQLHELLLTRAQVQQRTLVANRPQGAQGCAALPYKVISTPVFDALHRVIGVLAVFRDERSADFAAAAADALEQLALRAGHVAAESYDFTTGFLTEAAFVAQAHARLSAREACAGSSGVLYFDIDQLHVVNEMHGMPVGDEVILKVARLLGNRARGSTLVARLGGDRFAMFVPACSIEPVARIAEEIRAAAARLSGPRADKPLQVALSVGVARIAEGDRDFRQALAAAELACRNAKDRGRNRVEVFYGHLSAEPSVRGSQREAARIAAGGIRDSLELLVQPVLPLGALACIPRFEIFMRMRAADGTRLNFAKLLSAAVDASLPRTMDWWVIEQAVERLAAQRMLLQEFPAQFSINLSAESIGDAGFWSMLERLLRSADLPPGTLAFEFGEDAALSQAAALPGHLHRLRAVGVRFAIDGFGRGIGSLTNLASLPLACIKLDGALSRDLDRSPRSRSMALAITRLAQGFGLETVVTQVETDAIRACAAAIGIDFGQGFFIGRLRDLDDALRELPLYSCFEPQLAAAG